MGRTSSLGGGSNRKSRHRRIADILAEDDESSDESVVQGYGGSRYGGGGGMLPVFLNDQSDLVEVMLELDEESMVVRSVTPTSAAAAAAAAVAAPVPSRESSASLSRSSSTASRIRRKFSWLLSPTRRRTLGEMLEEEEAASASGSGPLPPPVAAMSSRDARRIRARLERTRSGSQRALKGLRFISRTTKGAAAGDAGELWRRVEARFDTLAKDGLLSREDFGECIGMVDSKDFAVGIFDALARRRRQNLERITKEELYDFWLQISDQSFDARLQIFFDMVDTNVDGRITRQEVQELIVLSASANKLAKLKEQAEEYAALIMEELDPENLGYIELWQLEALLLQRDTYMNYSRPLSSASAAAWSQNITAGGGSGPKQQHQRRRPRFSIRRTAERLRMAARENWQRAWVVALWMITMAALFSWKFVQYRNRAAFRVMGYCLPVAKGAAETLKLNMALVLLPVCRNTLTWLRSTRARLFVPFDDNITFHKTIATAIVFGILLHAGNHLACDFPRLANSSPAHYQAVERFFGSERPTYGSLVVGVEGLTGIAMVVLMCVSFTLATHRFRKNGVHLPFPLNRLTGFNAFWYSHHLLAVVYLLLLLHGYFVYLIHEWYQRTTWMYICVPLLLYAGERNLRAFRSKAYYVKILKVSMLPGNVLTVTMSKPNGFRYRSGQYIFLQCPTISPFEWHPFSITSAPGDDYLSVHIRTNGDWTQELKRIFIENYFTPHSVGKATFDGLGSLGQKRLPRLFVDGPYGAPAQDFRNYDVLLLVGLGIGATPFISILRDLLNNIKLADELMDLAMETSRSEISSASYSLSTSSSINKKRSHRTSSAHFYWVTREAGSFEWFKGVMNDVADMDKKGIIEMHNYLTSVYEERDARTTLLSMVQALNHAKHGVDIVSGIRVRTHFARPNWKEVFTKLASKHPGATVGVFYCGAPTLAKELRNLSLEMSHKTSTRFHFHKEYF
ncbi:respiratory burst oxidase homolog protein E-like [Zingiber officinale]|uniref:respiratory burst oxidase homolog protein E-like n=1 Tax=Zingiber officinale TaxID=94328 RepID=UPI001C4C85FF|nr:respiratory burst oxidase homolog protein E-like [Zingiber officinale]